MDERLQGWARERGYVVAWGPVAVAHEARDEILGRRARGELHDDFYRSDLEPLAATSVPEGGATIVVVARPAPAHLVHFESDGGSIEALLPPTYMRYRATFEEVRQDLSRHGLPGHRVDHFAWPLKAVAARLGLVRYGRNNITYAGELGSYVQLCGFVTDAPLPAPRFVAPAEPALLDECVSCGACISACPTGAIADDRTLLRVERCLTWANEQPGPWPPGVPAWAHQCLLGCLACQQSCPANPDLAVVDTGLAFSPEETRALLDDATGSRGRTESGVRVKLAWLGQPYAEGVLGRNLRALVAASRCRAT